MPVGVACDAVRGVQRASSSATAAVGAPGAEVPLERLRQVRGAVRFDVDDRQPRAPRVSRA